MHHFHRRLHEAVYRSIPGERAPRSPQNEETFCIVPLFISHYLGWYLVLPKFGDQFPVFKEKKKIVTAGGT